MKLIALYIENFGGLHHYTLDFEAGITSVIQPNGFGKTTLAEFIRAMFYGFPRKSKTLEKSRRQKYTPWNGGQFGGNLAFEYEGQQYRVERSFGANPKGDTFAVIDLAANRKTNRFSEELGQELFGLDADSFERSVYLPQQWVSGSLATASIQAKLSDLVEDSTDAAGFDKAMATLKAGRSALVPYRGSGGLVAEASAETTRLQLQLDALRIQEKRLAAAQEENRLIQQQMSRTEASLRRISDQLQTASRQEADSLRRQQYLELQNRHRRALERLRFSEKKYPNGLPEEDALRRAEIAAERLKRCENQMPDNESAAPAEQLEKCRSLCRELTSVQAGLHELHRRKTAFEQEKALCAAEKFRDCKAPAVAIMLAAVELAVGAVLVFLLEWISGIAVLGIGAVTLVSGITALCIRNGKRRRQQRAAEKNLADLQRQINAGNRMAEEYKRKIEAFFAGFGLRAEPRQYAAILEELESRRMRGMHQSREIADAREELRLFFARLGLPCEQQSGLKQLREDLQTAQTARILVQELEEQLAIMEETFGDVLLAEPSALLSPQQLRHEEQQLRGELAETTTRILQSQQKMQQLRGEVARIPDVLESLEQAKQRLAEYREKADILDAAMAFLQEARENLATSYMGTIRSRFRHYLSMLGGADEEYLIDTDLQVQLERQGGSRELAYFSAGQSDLVMLCMRLSLADALFGGEEMFIILDDPFVNLDDSHTEQARLLLRKLSATRQILYLSCHSSRAI